MTTITKNDYEAFLDSKLTLAPQVALEVTETDIHDMLYPFQKALVKWALKKGRAAIFADCGLGKTLMQLEWARLTGAKTLILAPLAVATQTVDEGAKIGIDVKYAREQSDMSGDIIITNYDRLHKFDVPKFDAVILDESSILKNVDGKTRVKLTELFRSTSWRLCCTATPAPNDIAEFANHAEFLGVSTRQEMLSRFFVHDDEGWRLKGYAKKAFYQWMASWAMMLDMPSRLGFSDAGYELPHLNVIPRFLETDTQEAAQAQGRLFFDGLSGIQGRAAIRKQTIDAKVDECSHLVNLSGAQWLIWCGLNDEGRKLHKAIPDSVLIEGSDSVEKKESALTGFANGDVRVLITKPSIAGFGMNFQNCHEMAFLGLNDSYETYYQAVRRCWRYGQENAVNVWVYLADVERPIWDNVQSKAKAHDESFDWMVNEMMSYEQIELNGSQVVDDEYKTDTVIKDRYTLMLGDCVDRMKDIPDNSIDMSVFSPPFLSLYVYSDSHRDMGNSQTPEQFYEQFGFMLRELERVIKPGRNVCCHVAQVPAHNVHDGFIGIKDFRGGVIESFTQNGFVYHGEVVIDKDPQAQAIRTKSKALLFAQLKKDASWLRPGLADYILVFRKPGDNEVPIHPEIDNETWIQWARPVWYNIRESDTLNVAEARSDKDERHIAPLQLGTIERCIKLWSNPDEVVLSPFMGIGSEGYQALLSDRRFVGIELKPEYFRAAMRNLAKATEHQSQQRMF